MYKYNRVTTIGNSSGSSKETGFKNQCLIHTYSYGRLSKIKRIQSWRKTLENKGRLAPLFLHSSQLSILLSVEISMYILISYKTRYLPLRICTHRSPE